MTLSTKEALFAGKPHLLKGVTAKTQIAKFICCHISAPEHFIFKNLVSTPSIDRGYWGVGAGI
jgi:hypothetical protein